MTKSRQTESDEIWGTLQKARVLLEAYTKKWNSVHTAAMAATVGVWLDVLAPQERKNEDEEVRPDHRHRGCPPAQGPRSASAPGQEAQVGRCAN